MSAFEGQAFLQTVKIPGFELLNQGIVSAEDSF
jgi:hypothetical protein